jgi:hypothetical protein
MLKELSEEVNELKSAWATRLDPAMRLPLFFGDNVHGSIDCFPIPIHCPAGFSKQFFSGKYNYVSTHFRHLIVLSYLSNRSSFLQYVVKLQIVCDNEGTVIWYSGPHLGKQHDIKIYREHHPPLMPHERLLADRGYVGADNNLIVPYKRFGADLTPEHEMFNEVQSFYRVKGEHAIGFAKRLQVLSGTYRGCVSHPRFEWVIKVVMNFNYVANCHRACRPTFFDDLGNLSLADIGTSFGSSYS